MAEDLRMSGAKIFIGVLLVIGAAGGVAIFGLWYVGHEIATHLWGG